MKFALFCLCVFTQKCFIIVALKIWADLKNGGYVEKMLNLQPVPAGTTRAIVNSFQQLKDDNNSRRVLLSAISSQLSFAQVR